MAGNYENDSKYLNELLKFDGNDNCFECGSHPTGWVSVTYGIFLCRYCSVLHSHLEEGLSVVIPLHSGLLHLGNTNLQRIFVGGNRSAQKFFLSQPGFHSLMPLKDKYSSQAARDYRERLDMLCDSFSWTPSSHEESTAHFDPDFLLEALERPFDVNTRSQSSNELPASPDWSFQAEYGSVNYRSLDDDSARPSTSSVVDNTLACIASNSGWETLEGDNSWETRRGSDVAEANQAGNASGEHSAMRPSVSEPVPQWNEQQNELADANNSVAARNLDSEDLSQAGVSPAEPRRDQDDDDAWLNN